jgi:UDP-N-acetylglucosamine--N-acetylmuramyl-(pentapeptide) pyrophosphoryl-undecaprenol N-acetylglucosamine transferase
MSKLLVVMAGGTGGHVYPGLAVARAMRDRGWRVSWLGTPNGMETKLVDPKEFAFKGIAFEGIVGRGLMPKLRLPLSLLRAVSEAKTHFRSIKPDAAIGMGGFPSVPGGLAAWRMKIPLAIHQSDAVAGAANKLLARFAQRLLTGFSSTFTERAEKRIVTGNPIRREFAMQRTPRERFAARTQAINLLVMGGSRGSAALNKIVPEAIALIPHEMRPEVLHQAGANSADETRSLYERLGVGANVVEFIDESWNAMAATDLFIGRSGASTVSELAAIGVPSILVPYPHHSDQQQLHNARVLESVGAARIIEQSSLTAESLAQAIASLDRQTLTYMAERAITIAHPDATRKICDAIEAMCNPAAVAKVSHA